MSLLDFVRETEQQAQKIKQQAASDARELALSTEREAQALSAQKLAGAQKQAEALLAEAKAQIDQKARAFLSEQSALDQKIAASAAGRYDAAVEYIVERIDKL